MTPRQQQRMSISLSSISFEHKNMEYTPDLLKLPWKIENTLFSGIGKGFLRT
jgi:hypothetical protein